MKNPDLLLPIRIYGDEVLRQKAVEVTVFDSELRDFAEKLAYTMYERDGVGLAAPQVGRSIRMFVFDHQWTREGHSKSPVFVINPVIESMAGESVGEEGCISIPEIYAKVPRASTITYTYQDLDGVLHRETATDYPAIVFQHEFDHLDGILFTDKVSDLTKLKLKRKLRELAATTVDGINIRAYDPD